MEKKENDYDYSFKLICIGDGKKTKFLQLISDSFNKESKQNIGLDYLTRTLIINNEIIKLSLWDLASQERFRPIRNMYITKTDGIFLFFDVTSKYSYDTIIQEYDFIRSQHERIAPIMLIGNNCFSVCREISKEDVNEFAISQELLYREVDISKGFGINEAVKELVTFIIQCKKETDIMKCSNRAVIHKKKNSQNCI